MAADSAKDLFLGGAYLPPASNSQWCGGALGDPAVAFGALRDQILKYMQSGSVLLFGDFNAHLGQRLDVLLGAPPLLNTVGLGDAALALAGVPPTRSSPDSSTLANVFGN